MVVWARGLAAEVGWGWEGAAGSDLVVAWETGWVAGGSGLAVGWAAGEAAVEMALVADWASAAEGLAAETVVVAGPVVMVAGVDSEAAAGWAEATGLAAGWAGWCTPFQTSHQGNRHSGRPGSVATGEVTAQAAAARVAQAAAAKEA